MEMSWGAGRNERPVSDEEVPMSRAITTVADRMLNLIAPKAVATAANCYEVSCFCKGVYLYKRRCCDFQGCGPCTIVYRGGC